MLHPPLYWWAKRKSQQTYNISAFGLSLKIYPTVFDPTAFGSSQVLCEFLQGQNLNQSRLLEIGGGSGMVSILSAKEGALVTATDINDSALESLRFNARQNDVNLRILRSDVFEDLDPYPYDIIVTNPPFYSGTPTDDWELAFFTGEEHSFFQKLFSGIDHFMADRGKLWMVFSDDLDLSEIMQKSDAAGLSVRRVWNKSFWFEDFSVFEWTRSNDT